MATYTVEVAAFGSAICILESERLTKDDALALAKDIHAKGPSLGVRLVENSQRVVWQNGEESNYEWM